MNVKVQNALISGSVKAIPSKSFAHRICICDFLANNPICNKYDDFFSKDISATANCLMADGGTRVHRNRRTVGIGIHLDPEILNFLSGDLLLQNRMIDQLQLGS